MRVAIVYESRSGRTRIAAEAMGRIFEANGSECRVESVEDADPGEVSRADVVCVGSWTEGLFAGLRPGVHSTRRFVERLGDLTGKRAVVFYVYDLEHGPMLARTAERLTAKGARLDGLFRCRGAVPPVEFRAYAAGVRAADRRATT